MKKKVFCMLAGLLLLLTVCAACGKSNVEPDTQEEAEAAQQETQQLPEQDEAAFVSYAETYADLPKFSTQYYGDVQRGAFYGLDTDGIYYMENCEKTVIASGDYRKGRYCTDGKTFYVLKNGTEVKERILVRRDLESGVEETLFEAPYGELVGVIGEKIYFLLYGEDANDTNDNRLAAFDCSGNEIETVATGIWSADQKDGLILAEHADTDDSGAHGITVLSCSGSDLMQGERAICNVIEDATAYWVAPKDGTTVSIVKSDGKNRRTICDIDLPDGVNHIHCYTGDIMIAEKIDWENNCGPGEAFWLYDMKTGQPLSNEVLHLPQRCDILDAARDAVTGNIYAITLWAPHGYMGEIYQLVDGEMKFLVDSEYFDPMGGVNFEGINDGYLYYCYVTHDDVAHDDWWETVMACKKLPELQMAD